MSVSRRDPEGRVTGERRFLGLFTPARTPRACGASPSSTRRWRRCCAGQGSLPAASARDLVSVLEFFPRDELLQAEVEEILPTALGVLQLQERRRTRIFLRHDAAGGSCPAWCSCRETGTTRVGAKVQDLLREALDGGAAEHTVQVSESALARLHVVVRPRPGVELREGDPTELEAAVAQAVRSWDDDVLDAAPGAAGRGRGGVPAAAVGPRYPGEYRADVPPGAPSRTFSEWRTSSARSTRLG